jgi:probable F420-dependent oxidoreductase
MNWGVTLPLPGVLLADHRFLLPELEGAGYTDFWSAEVNGADAFTPLALAAGCTSTARLGTAIVPAYTRGPALIAMSAAAMAEAAPGRFVLGIGASSPAIVEAWNGMSFDQPFHQTRDVLRFVRAALTGEKVDVEYPSFTVRGFRLETKPASPPPIFLAALRPGMLALAGREADGAILNWLAATDVEQCIAAVDNPAAEITARIFVCPSTDVDYARTVGRRMIAAYLTVPAYAAFHDWLGRGDLMAPMRTAWAAGDRKLALKEISDELVDALVLHGSPESCRDQVQVYVDAGVTTPAISIVAPPVAEYTGGLLEMLLRMAPR